MIGIRWSNYYQHKGVEVMQFVDKDLKSIQEARILVESARDAHFYYGNMTKKHLIA